MTFNVDKLHIRPDGTVTVDLTSPQESGLGIIIGKMYYNTQIAELLGDMCSGYPTMVAAILCVFVVTTKM